jgi:DNA-binding response OmpR family regulator
LNSNDDILDALKITLNDAGFQAVGVHISDIKKGEPGILDLLAQHDPDIVVYDVAPPYDENWEYFKTITNLKEMNGRGVILTTTNIVALEKITGRTSAIELIGKPYDIQQILNAVHREVARIQEGAAASETSEAAKSSASTEAQ